MFEFLFAPILSLFSPRFYRSVLQSSVLKGFSYLIYLSLISAGIFVAIINLRWIPVAEDFIDWFSRGFPAITLTKDGISSSVEQPYEMKHPSFGAILILNTEKEEAEEEKMRKAFFYVTKTRIYANDPLRNETRIFDLKLDQSGKTKQQIENQVLTGETVKKFYRTAKPIFLFVFFFMMTFFLLLWKITTAFFYSVVALLLNQFREEKFSYAALLNVSCFSLTAVTLLQFLNLIAPQLHLAPAFWIAFMITTLYLGLAILIASPPEKEPEGS